MTARPIALAACLACIGWVAAAEDRAATLGKQRAAASPVEWEIREAGHPSLGNIRFAYVKRPVETKVGNFTLYSRAYFSCQKEGRRLAIELANATAPADPAGLQPAEEPRLICSRPTEDGKLVREELLASWEVNEKLGDALTRGLRPFPLRECAAISVRQEVNLPPGWGRKTASIEFDILPYARELDSIFATCGERSAYAPQSEPPAAVAAAPAAGPRAAPASAAAPAAKPAKALDASWREARVVATGRTNVRAKPSMQSAIVVALHPGSVVWVRQGEGDWWRARPFRGRSFDGYIREDRLVFK